MKPKLRYMPRQTLKVATSSLIMLVSGRIILNAEIGTETKSVAFSDLNEFLFAHEVRIFYPLRYQKNTKTRGVKCCST